MNEVYKSIEGFNNYEVSNLGNVRNKITGRILNCWKDKDGYMKIRTYNKLIKKTSSVHRLVAEAFIPNPNNYPVVNHKDEDKSNNHIDNLEWCTTEYNNRYGTRNTRVSIKNSKPIIQYDLEGNMIREWKSATEASRILGLSQPAISACCRGKLKTLHNYIWKYKTL